MFIFTLAQQICTLDVKGQIEKTELSQLLSFHIKQLKFLPSELQKACIAAHQECGFHSTYSQLVCDYKMVLILFPQLGLAYYPTGVILNHACSWKNPILPNGILEIICKSFYSGGWKEKAYDCHKNTSWNGTDKNICLPRIWQC